MGATQKLTTIISINAEAGKGFSQVGSTLTELGSIVDGISERLISFGKDSLGVYRDYEKAMRDTEVALSTAYGRDSQQLGEVMESLDGAATDWAAQTVFGTQDVANAVAEAAHAGWRYEEIMSGIPAAMELAQAGSIGLSEAVNYIVKATNSAGIGFEDMGEFIDKWVFSANSSASTVEEFGEAMLRMGSTMRFTGNTDELMTLLAVTANAGTVGSEAGTAIRNAILRLVAPTDKATEAMAELGATSEETAGLMDDEALAAANAELAAHGFSAFGDDGNMRGVLDIYKDLYETLGEIAGGYENIERNEESLRILSAIFPSRTITEALALIRSASDEYGGLYEQLQNGAAEGYGEYAATTMMDSLDGAIEDFDSKLEKLKQLTGERLSGPIQEALGALGDGINSITEMDEGTFDALVAGLSGVALSGPGLTAVGGAMRALGLLFTPTGAAAAAVTGFAALAAAASSLARTDLENAFGTAELDGQAIEQHIGGISESFREGYEEVEKYRALVEQSAQSYQDAASELSGGLLTAMVTDAEITDQDAKRLMSIGDQMAEAIKDGITGSTAASMSYLDLLFGAYGEGESSEQRDEMTGLLASVHQDMMSEAENIGQGMRDALTKAFDDGKISDDEYQKILGYMQSYNDALARAQLEAKNEEEYVKLRTLQHRAQTASLDEIEAVEAQIEEERGAVLQEAEDEYLKQRFSIEYKYNKAIENGTYINGQRVTEQSKERALESFDEEYGAHKQEIEMGYDDALIALRESQLRQSEEFGPAYAELEKLAKLVLAGDVSPEVASASMREQYGTNADAGENDLSVWGLGENLRTKLSGQIGAIIENLGGMENMPERIAAYREQGNDEMADRLGVLYAAHAINNKGYYGGFNEYGHSKSSLEDLDAAIQDGQPMTLDEARNAAESFNGGAAQAALQKVHDDAGNLNRESAAHLGTMKSTWEELGYIVEQVGKTYDLNKVLEDTAGGTRYEALDRADRENYALYQLLYGALKDRTEEYRLDSNVDAVSSADVGLDATVTAEIDAASVAAIEAQIANGEYTAIIDPTLATEKIDIPDQEVEVAATYKDGTLEGLGASVSVTGDTRSLQATIDAEDGEKLLAYVDGDATDLEMEIASQDGKELLAYVKGNVTQLQAAIDRFKGQVITVGIRGASTAGGGSGGGISTFAKAALYAEGGRATEASVFGEAGPEWAIPEEHTQRTASLLREAATASGFSWAELATTAAGGGKGSEAMPTTIVYSPTIHAADASGVAAALKDDKRRLEEWYKERMARERLEAYG